MEIIVIVIIIVVIFILSLLLYPLCKYYYLKKYKPNEFVEYAKTWLDQYIASFNYSFKSLEHSISYLDNNVNKGIQAIGMVFNTLQKHRDNDNKLYDNIESYSRNCIKEIDSMKTVYRDIKMDDKCQLCMDINNSLNNILKNFTDIGFGFINVAMDATRMSKEKEIKELCMKEIETIKEKYESLIKN